MSQKKKKKITLDNVPQQGNSLYKKFATTHKIFVNRLFDWTTP